MTDAEIHTLDKCEPGRFVSVLPVVEYVAVSSGPDPTPAHTSYQQPLKENTCFPSTDKPKVITLWFEKNCKKMMSAKRGLFKFNPNINYITILQHTAKCWDNSNLFFH